MNATIGRLTSLSKQYKSKFPEDTAWSLGGRFLKMLDHYQIESFARLTQLVLRPDGNSDHHIGDKNFQSIIIGNVGDFISNVKRMFSENYTVNDKEKKTFDFPQKLLETINTSKSAFNPDKLIENTISYLTRVQNRKEAVKVHPRVKTLVFKYWTSVWAEIQAIKEDAPREQQELILTGLAPNTNSGYPFWTKQTKKNFPKMFGKFLKQFFPEVVKRHRSTITDGYVLTVDIILDAIREAIRKEYYPPFTLFYRTQGGRNYETKHRSVYGGDIMMKAFGSLWAVAKHRVGLIFDGPIPWIAWQEWTEMFDSIRDNLPNIEDDLIVPQSANELQEKWPSAHIPDGDHIVEVYGEDFSGYDQSIIREDLNWITSHKNVGWIMGWILDVMEHGEVWFLGLRIRGIFFKSGHPMTSEFGSIIHRNFMENAAEYMGGICLGGTVLSDDNLGWYINFNEYKYLDYAKQVGLEIDKDKSSLYSRDHIVSFLKVLVGYVLKSSMKSYIGDPQSRYYGLAHSEREMVGQFDEDELSAGFRDLWRVTGDIEVDAFISKLGSFAEPGAPLVEDILRVVKDTPLGLKTIQAISDMTDQGVEPYRRDLFISFGPLWLARKLNVQRYLSEPVLS
jgi:hypothetical protein